MLLRGKHATRTMVLTILITLLCDKTCTGAFVTTCDGNHCGLQARQAKSELTGEIRLSARGKIARPSR
jgi:hypothetical protein